MTLLRNFHEGEAQMQAAAGINTETYDQAVEQPFQPEFNPSEERFVGKRTFSVAASVDSNGRPWASPLLGKAGELFVVKDPTTVRVNEHRISGDPLRKNIAASGHMGVLYFDPSLRRRAKSLGNGSIENDGAITYRMHRNFGLCTKYIYKRSHDMADTTERVTAPASASSPKLSVDDRAQLASADTIFLASYSTHFGADPTHRGGPEGFITVVDDTTLSMPDYFGNGMFQTLGNLLLDDRIGLLSLDFVTGRSLQITGRGETRPADPSDPYAERTLVIMIDEVRVSWADVGTWTDIEAFDLQGRSR